MESLGLRERKKRRTRETIARVALELFDRNGYSQTTIAEIAAAADVAPRTVSGYFPAKEELVFPEQDEALASLAARLREREEGEVAPEALRAWLRDRVAAWRGRGDEMAARRRLIASNEVLRAHQQLFIARARDLLAEAIAADVGAAPEDLEPRMAAAATTASIELLGECAAAVKEGSGEAAEREAEVLALLDRAVAFSAAGIRAIRDEGTVGTGRARARRRRAGRGQRRGVQQRRNGS